MLVVRTRSATDLLVFRGRSDLGVLAIEGLIDMENACGQCIVGMILVPTGTGQGALPGGVAKLFVEVAKCESHHLGRGTGSALTLPCPPHPPPRVDEVGGLETAETEAAAVAVRGRPPLLSRPYLPLP